MVMDMDAGSIEIATDVAFMHERFDARLFVLFCFLHGAPRQHHDSRHEGVKNGMFFHGASFVFPPLKKAYRQGNTNSVKAVEDTRPPTTTVASGR